MKKMLFRIPAIIVIAGMLMGSSQKVNAQAFTPNDNQVCFYENDNYGGQCICISSSGEYVDLTRFNLTGSTKNWDNKISSVIIGKNACAIMYEHPNAGGYCLTLRGTGIAERRIPKLSAWGFNDKASHIKSLPYPQNVPPSPAPNQVFFFEHKDFDGYYFGLSFDRDISNVSTYPLNGVSGTNWNDKISSMKVGSNACVTTWFDQNYGGQRHIFESDGVSVTNSPDLGPSGIGDKITSFKIRMRTLCSLK